MPGRGDCMFQSVAVASGMPINLHLFLRETVCDYIKINLDQLQGFIEE